MTTIFLPIPAPILQNDMNQAKYNNEMYTENSGAFGRIAQPYSGAAPHGSVLAKLERDGDFNIRFTH
ncbi:MAG: hypothetical protein WAX80_03175 [Minisyncoccia bacterium]